MICSNHFEVGYPPSLSNVQLRHIYTLVSNTMEALKKLYEGFQILSLSRTNQDICSSHIRVKLRGKGNAFVGKQTI